MYLKISTPSVSFEESKYNFSLKLLKNEKIKNIEVVNKDNILVLIDYGDGVKGVIYDIKKNKIIRTIER